MRPWNFYFFPFCGFVGFGFSLRDKFYGAARDVERDKKGKCEEKLETYGHMT